MVRFSIGWSVSNDISKGSSAVFISFDQSFEPHYWLCTRVGTLIVATIYLQLIQN